MKRIVAIEKSKTISYRDDTIEYFKPNNLTSSKKNYEKIIDKIKNARSLVKIASTSYVDENIIDALYANKNINSYIILKNFENSNKTVQRFDSRKPAILRQVEELENNFILIDKVAYFFLNPLSEEINISFYFDESEANDLEFIFNYYFWNRATKEKLIDKVSTSIDSPFPPFSLRKQKFVNVIEQTTDKYEKIYVPRDRKYNDTLDMKALKKYFSEDISTPIYIKSNNFIVGNFSIQKDINIMNTWVLTQERLGNIPSSKIILRKKDWKEFINIKEKKEIFLGNIVSKKIDLMDNVEQKNFPQEKYIKEIVFKWNIVPPSKPKNAKKSSLYKEHNIFQNNLKKYEEEKAQNESLLKNIVKKINWSPAYQKLTLLDYQYQYNEFDKILNKIKEENTQQKTIKERLKNITSNLFKLSSTKPKYILPDVGILYENKENYFLEIEYWEELDKAKKIQKEYNNKLYIVVK